MSDEERLDRAEVLLLDLVERVAALEANDDEGLSSLERQRRTFQARERREG